MLKWFRKYNKVILIVGCVVLMVAFLIPQAIQQFSPQPGDFVVGTMAGEEVRERDLQNAENERRLLEGLGLPPMLLPPDRETYLLQQRDARRLGLAVSSAEINSGLESLGLGGGQLETAASRTGVSVDGIRGVVANWLLTERYRMLVTGRRYNPAAGLSASPGVTTLSIWGAEFAPIIRQVQVQAEEQGLPAALVQNQLMQFAAAFQQIRTGNGRISPAAVKHLARNALERVGGRMAVLEPQIDEDAPVDEAQLKRLFNEYKEFDAGVGSPYPFGYRQPPRVDLELLVFPMEQAMAGVTVEPLDVLSFYRENKARLGDDAPDTPTPEARAEIEQGLKQQQALEVIGRALAEARAALDADVRSIPTQNGYRQLPDDFTPLPFEEVADRVEAATGFTPQRVNTNGAIPLDELITAVPGFAMSGLPNANARADRLISFTRELLDDGELAPLQVQVGVMMPATLDAEGTAYLPRLISAEQTEVLDSLEPVREQVTRDARRVAAFERLAEQTNGLREMAAAEGLDAIAEQYNTLANIIEPLPRLDEAARTAADGVAPAPVIPGVGRNRPLIDAAFEVVQDIDVQGELTEALPASDRIVAVPIDRQLAVAVFEVTRYEAPTRRAYDELLDQSAGVANDFALLGGVPIFAPLQREPLAARLGFDLDEDDEELPTEEPSDAPDEATEAAEASS
ncbi:MAG: hypothetical protein AAGF84_08045 [Planctomycetota bacterium]